MDTSEIAFLAAVVHLAHADCTYLRTVEVRQIHEGTTIWTGSVAVFQLHGHPTATECYGWMSDEVRACTPIMFLNSGRVDSPSAAVRDYVRHLCRELAA